MSKTGLWLVKIYVRCRGKWGNYNCSYTCRCVVWKGISWSQDIGYPWLQWGENQRAQRFNICTLCWGLNDIHFQSCYCCNSSILDWYEILFWALRRDFDGVLKYKLHHLCLPEKSHRTTLKVTFSTGICLQIFFCFLQMTYLCTTFEYNLKCHYT